jgi:hypothetical protein
VSTRTATVLLTADPAGLIAGMDAAAASTDAASDAMSGGLGGAGTEVGNIFDKIGSKLEALGIPGAAAFSKIGSSVSDADVKGKSFGDTLSTIGGVTLAAAAVGVVAFGAASIDLATKFQSSVTSIAGNAGITVAAAQKIGNAFLGTAGTTIYSAQSIATSYASVAAQLGATQGHALNATQAMTVMNAAMNLAEGSGTSLGSSTSALAGVMQVYGIKAAGAGTASDQLFQAARLSGNSVDSLSGAITKMHQQLGVATPPLGQAGALLVDLAGHGETGSRAIRSVSTALTTLLTPTEKAAQAQTNLTTAYKALPPSLDALGTEYEKGNTAASVFTAATKNMTTAQSDSWKAFTTADSAITSSNLKLQEAGITVTNAQGKFVGIGSVIGQLHTKIAGMTQANALATLGNVFGAKAAAQLYDTVKAGPAAYDKATASVDKHDAAQAAAEKQSQTLAHQLELLKATVEDEAVKFGSFLIPKLEDVGKAFAEVIEWVMKSKPVLIALGVLIGGPLVASVAMFVVGIGADAVRAVTKFGASLASPIDSLRKAMGAEDDTEASTAELNDALGVLGEKLGLVADSMARAASASESLAESQGVTADSAGELDMAEMAVGSAANEMADAFAAEEERLSGLEGSFMATGAAANEMADMMAEASTIGGEAVEGMGDAELAAGETGGAGLDAMTGGLLLLVPIIIELATHWKTVWKDIKKVAEDAWHFLDDNLIEPLKSAFDDVVHFLEKWGPLIAELILVPFTGGLSLIVPYVVTHWDQVTTFFESIPGKLVGALADFGSDLLGWIDTAWSGLVSEAASLLSTYLAWWLKIPTLIVTQLVNLGSDLVTWITTAFNLLLSGATSALGTFLGWVVSIPGKILAAIGALGTLLLQAGSDVITGLLNGIEAAWNTAYAWLALLVGKVTGFFSNALTWLLQAGKDILTGLLNGLKAAWNDVTSFIGGIGSWITSHKGPPSVDAVLLFENGRLIMQGLHQGLQEGFNTNVAPYLSGLSATIAGTNLSAASSVNSSFTANGPGAAPSTTGANSAQASSTIILQMDTTEVARALFPGALLTQMLQTKRSFGTLGLE